MEVAGQAHLGAARERVWEVLNDPQVLEKCLPGCERLVPEGEDAFAADLKVGIAAVRGSYRGRLRVLERRPPEFVRLEIHAEGTGGFVDVRGRIELAEDGAGGTRVAYRWDVSVGGPVAMVGGRVLGGVARYVIDEFFRCVSAEVQAREDAAQAHAGAAGPPGDGGGAAGPGGEGR